MWEYMLNRYIAIYNVGAGLVGQDNTLAPGKFERKGELDHLTYLDSIDHLKRVLVARKMEKRMIIMYLVQA